MGDFAAILVDAASAAAPNEKDRGWRFRVFREADEDRVHIFEEQVWPEKVNSHGANHFRAQNEIGLSREEANWMRDQIAEAFGGQPNETITSLTAELSRLRGLVKEACDAGAEYCGAYLTTAERREGWSRLDAIAKEAGLT